MHSDGDGAALWVGLTPYAQLAAVLQLSHQNNSVAACQGDNCVAHLGDLPVRALPEVLCYELSRPEGALESDGVLLDARHEAGILQRLRWTQVRLSKRLTWSPVLTCNLCRA